ncbi:transcription initiation factor IIA large subunit [Cladorrhinum samala]|uniref:Transcription initiation factor IIA large subunit n=1 Tax=Cladorrhinum samala TaxID=585594 RepID=A0AAV9I1F5_9PEZI|nr:transcription initiation factor IIA large subunit [Cladorrhinum samala]
MSNNVVGSVYETIIQEVINSVRVDFEENGVDDGVLEDLKKNWQARLSQMNIAQFPWDPRPEQAPPQPTAAQQAAAAAQAAQAAPASATNYTASTLSPQASAQPVHGNGLAVKNEQGPPRAEPVIKQEPGLANSAAQQMNPAFNNQARAGTAAQRAAMALSNQYGDRATASINAIHNSHMNHLQQQQQQPQPQAQQFQPQQQQQQQQQQQHQAQQQMQQQQQQMQQRPGQGPQQLNPQQYRQGIANQMQQQMQQRLQQVPQHGNPPNGLPTAQVDGAGDDQAFEGVLMQRGSDGQPVEMGRVEIDDMIHAQMAARAKQLEGGGLMLPLKEATKHRGVSKKKAAGGGAAQFDGGDDDLKDEELDEDAINSDLDDPDDENDDDDDDDDAAGHMMLCMYDKVQRVKNKWKCTLKDGVLTVNGREYVFHKATGEYEW